jgi:adenosylcobinamide-GDP ribazoletransferase
MVYNIPKTSIWIWGICLFALSLFTVSLLFAAMAIVVLFLWWAFLKWKVGGMTGDCLGAGIEYCECAMLLAVGLM